MSFPGQIPMTSEGFLGPEFENGGALVSELERARTLGLSEAAGADWGSDFESSGADSTALNDRGDTGAHDYDDAVSRGMRSLDSVDLEHGSAEKEGAGDDPEESSSSDTNAQFVSGTEASDTKDATEDEEPIMESLPFLKKSYFKSDLEWGDPQLGEEEVDREEQDGPAMFVAYRNDGTQMMVPVSQVTRGFIRGQYQPVEEEESGDIENAEVPSTGLVMSWKHHLALSCYWASWSFLWLPLLVVLLPLQIEELHGGEGKGSALAHVLLYGSLASLLCAPLFGSLSDSCTHSLGRRRPFMLWGGLVTTGALLVMSLTPPMWIYSAAFMIVSVANNMLIAPYSALVPDVVPLQQRGIASGWLGGMSMVGYLLGGSVSYFVDTVGIFITYLVLIVFHGCGLFYTIRHVKETAITKQDVRRLKIPHGVCDRLMSIVHPFFNHDFRVVFYTRFLFQMGIMCVQEYLQYYLEDAVGDPLDGGYYVQGVRLATSPEAAVSILFIPILLGALVSSIVSGFVSDFLGGKRKAIVYASGFVMSAAALGFAFTRTFTSALVLASIFGIGFGSFSVADWAMITDVLPSKQSRAKDMGVITLALVLPQVFAAPAGGLLVDVGNLLGGNLGYSAVFLFSTACFMTGTYLVRKLEMVQ